MGRGYLSYSRHPQTVPLYHHLWQFAAQQHGWEMDQFHSIYGIMNLVLHSNFDSYMFCLLIYFYYIKGLIHSSRNRNKSIFNICTHCTGCTDYRYCYLMTGTLWKGDHMKWTSTMGEERGRGLATVDICGQRGWGEKCQNFSDFFYGRPLSVLLTLVCGCRLFHPTRGWWIVRIYAE